ncbi:hypothetical protein SDC9_132942 [bioreactor metagenome]|uniref:Lipoprotein n=1 Tax=bioreactor metagenome TaxID=1076179 RepID=A0A645D9K3_9ZZZZ
MKLMKLIFSCLFFILIFTACETYTDKEPRFETYINHGITACGVKDPLVNYAWLCRFIEDNKDSRDNITIYLYANVETSTENIVIDIYPNRTKEPEVSRNVYYWIKIYSCTGEQLYINNSNIVDYESWDNFYYSGQNTVKGIIWYRRMVYPK